MSQNSDHADAAHLVEVWLDRERAVRAQSKLPGGTSAEADAIKQCRLDLQWTFRLVARTGSGPMTDAETREYIAHDTAFLEHHTPPTP